MTATARLAALSPLVIALGGSLEVATSHGLARDFGVLGRTWPVAEPDLLQTIAGRLGAMQASGGIARMQRALAARAEARVRRPEPVAGLATTEEPRRWTHDPSIVVEADIRDHKGQLIAAAGTRINPLASVTLRQTLVFVDGDDPKQIRWATGGWRASQAKIILVRGSPFDLMNVHQRRFFFDQRGSLTARFGIEHVPALVRAQGKVLAVEEVVLAQGTGA